jgi:KUP system potassium uptake protein
MVMLVTTFLMIPIMLLVWRSHWTLVILFTMLSLVVEIPYFSAVVLKIDQGGWVSLVFAAAFLIIMYVWHYGTLKRYEFEMHSKVSMAWILGLGLSLGLVRVPGIGLVYTELASGVPHIFSHLSPTSRPSTPPWSLSASNIYLSTLCHQMKGSL